MKNTLLIAPTVERGGISTWANKYLKCFASTDFRLVSIDSTAKHRGEESEKSQFKRIHGGLIDLKGLRKEVKAVIKNRRIDIMHTTTSGSLGTFRDYVLGKMCKKNGLKTIMHCHYGNIPEVLNSKGLFKYFLLYTMGMYDELWILDSRTEGVLKKYDKLKDKVYIMPNGIDVVDSFDDRLKSFKKIAFVGSLIPSKGVFELIEAVLKINRDDVILYIIGAGDKETNETIKSMCKEQLGTKVQLLGKMANKDAVDFMNNIDILALPTYYKFEAFPISILEAMSRGKLVISTNRAAIPNMLTALDGSMCGILVEEKSADAIKDAIEYCIDHPNEGNRMCEKAFQKAKESYSLDVVYKMCEERYRNISAD
jgi:glycosyltransferase involved in cell wall biosynthesis